MERITRTFKNRAVIFGNGDDVIAPYFPGYCGEHTSQHNGAQQLGGPPQYRIPALLMMGPQSAPANRTNMGPRGKGSGLKRRASVAFGV